MIDAPTIFWSHSFVFRCWLAHFEFSLFSLSSACAFMILCDTEFSSAYCNGAQNVLRTNKKGGKKNGWFIYYRIYLDKWAARKKIWKYQHKNKEIYQTHRHMHDVCVFCRFSNLSRDVILCKSRLWYSLHFLSSFASISMVCERKLMSRDSFLLVLCCCFCFTQNYAHTLFVVHSNRLRSRLRIISECHRSSYETMSLCVAESC